MLRCVTLLTVEHETDVKTMTNTTLLQKMTSLSQDELFHALYTDTLTGVLNRRALDEMDGHRIIAIVDLDSLKYLNDTHGHRTGDRALCMLADALAAEFGADHTYRISGDEFALVGESVQGLIDGLNNARDRFPCFSLGIGHSFEAADAQLRIEKHAREQYGMRAPRGEMPPWIESFIDQRNAA